MMSVKTWAATYQGAMAVVNRSILQTVPPSLLPHVHTAAMACCWWKRGPAA